ncbi:MAG: hypothetical protein JWO72_2211 [Caulobacteraceae bacterium]|nr:hypothetical protein [Caulobacteraceae bacterium]
MKPSDLKWWHWTLATIAIAVVVRLATGGPLPFLGAGGPAPAAPPAASPRPHRAPNQGPSMLNAVTVPDIVVERALPELNRLTIEASVANPGKPVALVDQSGVLIREIARALQAGVSEDSDAVALVRVLVATKGKDRTGKEQAHLPLYALDFNAADLFALKPDQARLAAILGLATNIVFNGADAHDAARQWCAVADNQAAAKRLCGIVATAKGV